MVTVLVVNVQPSPVLVTLEVAWPAPLPLDGTTGTVLFEQRTVAVTAAGAITDFVDGFGTRAYRVAVASGRSDRRPSPAGTTSKANLVLNPSFEVQSSAGRPDSYLLTYGLGSSVLADAFDASDGYYSVRVINTGTATSSSVGVAGISSFLGSRIVGNASYVAGIDARGASDGVRLEIQTCVGNRYVCCGPATQAHALLSLPRTPRSPGAVQNVRRHPGLATEP